MNNIRFQYRMKEAREAAGYKSQQSLADALGVAQSTVGGWESGKREPDFETLCRIASLLSVSIDWLIGAASKSTCLPAENVMSVDQLRHARVGSPQPVSLLAQIYGITADDLREICGPALQGPAELWVTGDFSLSGNDVVRRYPSGDLLRTLAVFFDLSQSSLMAGGDFPVLPDPAVQAKLNRIKEQIAVRRYNYYRALGDGVSETPPSAEAAG